MSQHGSVWLATSEIGTHPPLERDVGVDVVVVGGGITGLTTALLLQRAGARVLVVEADRVGGGTTGHTTGKVTSQHSVTYAELIRRHGERKARLYADANQHAIGLMAGLAAEHAPDCDFRRAPAYVYTRDPNRRATLGAEHDAALRLGLPASLTSDIDLPFPVEVALRFEDQAHFHPGRYLQGLAAAFEQAGGRIVEGTRALDVDEHGSQVTVRTSGAHVTAEHVVLATLLPIGLTGGFFARARPTRAYGIAARLRGEPPTGMHIALDPPTVSTRPWIDAGRAGLIVVGEAHTTGHGDATPGRWGELERWANDHFEVESFEHRWSAQDYTPVDNVPFIGRSPGSQRTFVATGFNKWGLTNGTAAAHILSELLAGRHSPWLEAFDATRIGDAATIAKLVEDNLHVAKDLVTGRVDRLEAGGPNDLERGGGRLIDVAGRTVAAYRHVDGRLEGVSPTCTHLGCTVRWNSAESSWDCPCHGSRFSPDGAVLQGPATGPLQGIDLETGKSS